MTTTRSHVAEIADFEDAPASAMCALSHIDPAGYGCSIGAEVRLILATSTGLRYVDLCDLDGHEDLPDPGALVEFSTPLDPAMTQLEAAVDCSTDWAYWTSLIERPS